MKAAAGGAPALRTIWRATENAGLDARLEVSVIVNGHFGEKAIVGTRRRIDKRGSDTRVHKEFRKFLVEEWQLTRDKLTVNRGQHFGALLADLGSIEADPNAVHLRSRIPEGNVVFEVAGAIQHRASDHPVDVDFTARDILQDALVSGGLAANVVVLREAVDGYGDAQPREIHPFERNWNHAAGDYEGEDVHGAEGRQNSAQFAMAHQRLAADQRDVHGLVLADEVEDPIDKSLAAKIAQPAESFLAAKVRVAVGITTWATERTLARDLDGEHRRFAGKNFPPRGKYLAWSDAGIRIGCGHIALMRDDRTDDVSFRELNAS